MKKIFLILAIFILLLNSFRICSARDKIEAYFFYSKTCPHCAEERSFLNGIEKKYPEIEVKKMEASGEENMTELTRLYEKYGVPQKTWGWVPILFIGEKYFLGYENEFTTGKEIEDYIAGLIQGIDNNSSANDLDRVINLPLFGPMDISRLSPLFLAIILGALDGFNACAMVVLGFLLTILVSTGIREKVILIGGTFILVSGIIYFLFISAWLNLFLVLERIRLITVSAGIVVILFSLLLLKDYFQGVTCKLCEVQPGKQGFFNKIQERLFEKIKDLSLKKASLPLLLLGVAAVSGAINLIELVCSFGFPLAFTEALSDCSLPQISYYFYILIYTIFYMIDDFIIFLIAVFTLKITRVSARYLKVIKLISAFCLLVLGLVILFKPELLAFS